MYADSGIKAFAPDMIALALEVAQHDEEARRDLREAYETIFGEHIDDWEDAPLAEDPPFADELVSHGLMGAFEQMLARASLDDEYSWREVVRTTLGLYLAVRALYRGDLDIRDLIDRTSPCWTRSRSCRRPSRRSSAASPGFSLARPASY